MELTTATSASLLDGLKDRDNDKWKPFVDRYTPIIIRTARKRGLSPADADEVAQSTFIEFQRGYLSGKYDSAKGRLRSWLSGIARHEIFDTFDKRKRQALVMGGGTDTTGLIEALPDPNDWEQTWEDEWRREVLQACLVECRRLFDTKTMEAFNLHAEKGMRAKEVAELLGMTENAVYLAKHHVLKKIQELRPTVEEHF